MEVQKFKLIQQQQQQVFKRSIDLMTPNNYNLTPTGYYSDTYHVLHPTQSHHHHQFINNSPYNNQGGGGHFVGVPHMPVVGSSISEDLNRSFSSTISSSRFPGSTTQQGLSLSLSYRQQAAAGSNNGRDIVMGSKYLKAAQELLDEVVKVVGKGINGYNYQGGGEDDHERREKLGKGDHGGGREEGSGGHDHQLTTAQRQDLQMKKAKLVNMLDEVEQRYKQYHNQMQIVVSSFEEAVGTGSTKSYTSLALQTISKQFRSLKDTIAAQIKTVAGGLGEDDIGGYSTEGSTRVLKFVDQQLRQQRALHQIGMIMPAPHHHNAWRPQRGLPETAVSVLRAWLFEHFLHPYPKDSDKHMLAKQTGLTRSQVSNWFINARVRLWKPMVEEMYLEEMKQQSNIINVGNGESKSVLLDHHANVIININNPTNSTFHHAYSSSPKKAKNPDNISFGTYPDQIGHFDHDQEELGAGFHDFLSNQMVQTSHYGSTDHGMITINSPHSSNIMMNNIINGTYETITSTTAINNHRERFAAPLLPPDFVA